MTDYHHLDNLCWGEGENPSPFIAVVIRHLVCKPGKHNRTIRLLLDAIESLDEELGRRK